jgi:superfamily II DNA or RNA helicase
MKEIIYVYTTKTYKNKNWYKIGETTQESASIRISQQDSTSNPEKLEKQYDIDITNETDFSAFEVEQKIHKHYDRLGKTVRDNREWFEVDGGIEEIKKLIESILDNSDLHRSEIKLKPHQIEANLKINECFNSDEKRCLLSHKPRSGKTFTTIYNIKENNYKNVVILTSYPILNFQWEEVILGFKGFSNTEIIIGSGLDKIELNPDKNSIVLLSLQDVKGGEEVFEKEKFDLIKDIEFDLLVIDEVHYGVETEKTQDFLNKIKYTRMLGLSATPTRNLLCGRFSKEQIHNYTLVEEVKLKKRYPDLYPYADINFLIWNLSNNEKSELKYFSDEEQFKFDKFFRIEGDNFYYKSDIVYLFKKLIGDNSICRRDKLGTSYPFKNNGEFSVVKSILLFVPNIAVQYKLKELLEELESYDDFDIHITNSGEYSSKNLMKKIKRDFKSGDKRSLILAVDQLTTGITLDDCDMVALMNDWRSVDKYVQASFRCQSPREGKLDCWILDFNAARSFELMWEYQNIISKNNGKSLTENISEWVECVNIFNRIEGEMIKVDFDGFNNEYNKAVLERPRFNYQSVILQDKLGHDNISKALMAIAIKGGSSSSEENLNDDGIDKGKSKKSEKKSIGKGELDEDISQAKLMEIAKALVDKTMLLSIFTYFKYDNVDDCFKALEEDDTTVKGIGELESEMYLETLLLGMNEVDNISLSVIKFIYDNIYNKEIINKKIYIFNQNVNLIYNSIRENPGIISDMLAKLMELVDSYLKPSNTEKKMLGEVFTSLKLVEEMLDKLPKEVWSDPNLKWLDPANGIGNFPVIIVKNLMEGLKEWQPDSDLRLKHILENMIYVCELQSKNMFIYLQLFDSENKYKMNFYRGSFIDEGFSEVMKEWRVDKFDIVVGNPPYQELKNGNKKSQSLWDKFVENTIKLLSESGYVCFIHPSGWRDIDGLFKQTQKIMIDKEILYLSIHSEKDGIKNFKADTRYDYYVMRNIKNNGDFLTKIRCQDGTVIETKLYNMDFIPNGMFNEILNILAKENDEKTNIISDSSYHTQREFMSISENDINKYPCIYTVKNGDIPTFWYSDRNTNGHFGIPKLIWSNGRIISVGSLIDREGKYGLSQFSYAIVDEPENLENIKKAFDSKKFRNMMENCSVANMSINRKIISTFKKDFWKEFI